MTSLDAKSHISRPAARTRRPRRALSRRVITGIDALLEGALAAATLFVTALAYHLIGLHLAFDEFSALAYASYAVLTGLIYGTFSSLSCWRLLETGDLRLPSIRSGFYAWTATLGLILLIAFLGGFSGELSRVSMTAAYIVGIPLLLGVRGLLYQMIISRIRSGELHFDRAAIVGQRADVVNFLVNGQLWRHGQRLAGTLYLEELDAFEPARRQRALTDFVRHALRSGADQIVLVGDMSDFDGLERMVEEFRRFSLNVVCAPATRNATLKLLDVVAIGPNNAVRLLRKPMSDLDVAMKRAIDIIGAGLGLVLLSPLLLLTTLAILVTMGRPIIYRQERRGFNGEQFLIWKFRSMSVTESGRAMQQAVVNDPRVTRVGRIIRATSIDELPQLFNVLAGHMSLIGPRPHAISHDDALERQVEKYAHRQRIKPGITGWAQVNGYRGETRTIEQAQGRTSHDLYYIENWSLAFDFWIILLTVFSPTTRRNAH